MKNPTVSIVTHLPITKARINLGQVAKRAHLGHEYFILEKDGIPVIGIMGADELEDYLERKDARINAQIIETVRRPGSDRRRSCSKNWPPRTIR